MNKFVQCKVNNTRSVLGRPHELTEVVDFQVQNRRCEMWNRISLMVNRFDRYILPLIAGLVLSISAFPQTPGEPTDAYPASAPVMQFPVKPGMATVDPQVNLIKDRMLSAQVFHPANIEDPVRTYFVYPSFAGSAESLFRVEDLKIPDSSGSMPIRRYAPNTRTELPLWVSAHAGNAVGGLHARDVTLPAVTNRWNCPVGSVGCQPAQGGRYLPAADNAYATTKWVAENPAEIGQNPRTPLSATPSGTFGLPPIPGTPQTPSSEANRAGNIDLTTLAAHFRVGLRFRRQN